MASKGEVQAARERAARRGRARTGVNLAVIEALEAGVAPDEIARWFSEVLRQRGLLASADQVVAAARTAKKK